MQNWKPEVLDTRGDGYGFVMDRAETARAVFSYGYPNSGLNITQGNWGPLSPAQLREARTFVEESFRKRQPAKGARRR